MKITIIIDTILCTVFNVLAMILFTNGVEIVMGFVCLAMSISFFLNLVDYWLKERAGKKLCEVTKNIDVLSIIDSWPFSLRAKALKALISTYSLYVATSDGREEFIEPGQVVDNEQSGMITIQLEEI